MLDKTIKLRDRFSKNLSFRHNANELFDYIESMNMDDIITLDFSGIHTMSRSFAHQYLLRKNKNKMCIFETGKSNDIDSMFRIVKDGKKIEPLTTFGKTTLLTLGTEYST